MLYSGATLVPGLIFPPLEYRYLKDFARGVTVPVATLVDIAIRALSPAVNGPTTAVQALAISFSTTARKLESSVCPAGARRK